MILPNKGYGKTQSTVFYSGIIIIWGGGYFVKVLKHMALAYINI